MDNAACGKRFRAEVLAISGLVVAAAVAMAETVELAVPAGVLPPEVPAENPVTAAKIELGKRLFFDTRLSTDGTVACSTCHDPRHAFADGRASKTSAGVGGALGTRNAPTVLNAAFLLAQFWDGRADTLEVQAVQPLINPIEHGFPDHPSVVARLEELKEYGPLFRAAFDGGDITIERVGQAIASFERTLISLEAPIDRFLAGEESAISEAAKRGWDLFNGKARCNNCHGHIEAFPLFTNEDYHNLGVGVKSVDFAAVARKAADTAAKGQSLDELGLTAAEASELGRFAVTREAMHLGAFKTPQLRNVARTAPYMHDGSETSLRQVIEFYDRGGNDNPYLDGGIRPLDLTDGEKADLVKLLETFTSDDLQRFEALGKSMSSP